MTMMKAVIDNCLGSEQFSGYSKTCLKRFLDRLSLNAGQKYCRSILQYFRPSLSYHLSLRPLFCLFLSGLLRQVLLYCDIG